MCHSTVRHVLVLLGACVVLAGCVGRRLADHYTLILDFVPVKENDATSVEAVPQKSVEIPIQSDVREPLSFVHRFAWVSVTGTVKDASGFFEFSKMDIQVNLGKEPNQTKVFKDLTFRTQLSTTQAVAVVDNIKLVVRLEPPKE